MSDEQPRASTRNTRLIKAAPEAVYQAFIDPEALALWQAPGEMTGVVHRFDGRVGGGYQMSLYYPDSDADARGKTAAREDRFTSRFVELTPPKTIVQAITFDAVDAAFSGEMLMIVDLQPAEGGTNVTITFQQLPPGIRPEDNEAGTEASLEKLARYVER